MSTRGTLLALTGLTGDSEGPWFDVPADGRERIAMQSSVSAGTATVVFEGRITADDLPVLLKTIVGSGAYYGPKMPQMRARVVGGVTASVNASINAVVTELAVSTPVGDGGSLDVGSGGPMVLPNIGTPGSYGGSSSIPTVTVNSQGLVTAVSTNPITIPPQRFRGAVVDNGARDSLPSPQDGDTIYSRFTKALYTYDSGSSQWKRSAEAVRVFDPMADYGAKFDGVTDDTAAIQACIDAMKAAQPSVEQGGGCMVLPPGKALVDQLIFKNMSGFKVVGAGAMSSVLEAVDKYTENLFDATSAWSFVNALPSTFSTQVVNNSGSESITSDATGTTFVTGGDSDFARVFSSLGVDLLDAEGMAAYFSTQSDGTHFIWNCATGNTDSITLERVGTDVKMYRATFPTNLVASLTVTATNAKYWRVRRDASQLVAEVSPDGTTYTEIGRFTVSNTTAGSGAFHAQPYAGQAYVTGSCKLVSISKLARVPDKSKAVIEVWCDRYALFSGFRVNAHNRIAGIRSGTLLAGGEQINSSNRYEHVYVYGGENGWFWQGGYLTQHAWAGNNLFTDSNNDLNTLVGCTATGYTKNGYLIGHSQSKKHRFFGCEFSGLFDSTKTTERDNWQNGVLALCGSFAWYSGGGGHMSGADFTVSGCFDGCLIVDFDGEGSNRFLRTCADYVEGTTKTDPATCPSTTFYFPITARECRVSCENINADGRWASLGHSGPSNLCGNKVAHTAVLPVVGLDAGGGFARALIMGNSFEAASGTPVCLPSVDWSPVVTFGGSAGQGSPSHHVVCHSNYLGGNAQPGPIHNGATMYVKQSEAYYSSADTATTITLFKGARVGLRISFTAQDAFTTIQHNANIRLSGGVNYAMATGDTIYLEAAWSPGANTYIWRETGRSAA